jgi:hypothetical protein
MSVMATMGAVGGFVWSVWDTSCLAALDSS